MRILATLRAVGPAELNVVQAAIEEVVFGSALSAGSIAGRLRMLTSLLIDLSQTRHAEAILVANNMRLAL